MLKATKTERDEELKWQLLTADSEWLRRLKKATLIGYLKQAKFLADDIASLQPDLAHGLQEFQHGKICDWLE